MEKTRSESRSVQNRAKKNQAAARVLAVGELLQDGTKFGVGMKSADAVEEPIVEPARASGKAGDELVVEAFGVVHQKSRMNFEKAREEFAGALGHMRTSAVFDLRKVGLANALSQFLAGGAGEFGLSKFPAEAAKDALGVAEGANFFAELHGRLSLIAIYL